MRTLAKIIVLLALTPYVTIEIMLTDWKPGRAKEKLSRETERMSRRLCRKNCSTVHGDVNSERELEVML